MKKFNKSIIVLLLCCLVFSACSKNTEKVTTKKEVKENESASFKKFSKGFFGVFDTDIAFSAYCASEKEFNKYFKFLEEDMKRYHNLYNSFENANENNIKTINDNAGKEPVKVDKEIIELLEFSIENYKKLSNKTNIGLGSVTTLWRAEKDLAVNLKGKLPDANKIKEGLKHTNIDNIVIDKEKSTVFLKDKDMRLDVGAIAKGYSVEKVMNKLKKMGLKSAIISAGGNVKAIGSPLEKDKNKWGIGIQAPTFDSKKVEIQEVIFTDETCAVTSGDYQRFYFVDDKAYNHIIDPQTGYPKDKIKSVTILCKDSGLADFISTSLFLMDVEEGKKLLEKVEGTEAFWILADGSVHYTKNMEKLLQSKGATNK
ncbi:FAD:protein FMN transferase [uncultured Parvimonas sp.]|uniref:FAD:protein FMN transferase n=1 Tax=uncultured Parvimonas sp. TaxID=747372 RepID=UPI00280494FA|nr:FAD:protein FMN transferase [uncultured Parvimonas sp.]